MVDYISQEEGASIKGTPSSFMLRNVVMSVLNLDVAIYNISNEKYRILRLFYGNHAVIKLNKAFLDKESKVLCEFVEPVEYRFENYYKDVQCLASRECYWIDRYQKIDQCFEQIPEGRRPDESWWNEQVEKMKS